ncbi:thiol reductant ABC exporter subunit CydD [Ruania halotolerans]|uniref:thiol reductant ABC exporter subunit CydD n=1 Tax=Ruania halotolerans TaxID=2897773 RepID=UPI001E5F6D18|nr:thiol reductant ABC exporter subunit CydD [Ruania halotolerans]UFU07864.1 thiol reductant ABC exporter subunit CydD [Ruania halotolerans]
MKPFDARLIGRARAARGYLLLTVGLTALTTACVLGTAVLLAGALAPVITGVATLADVWPQIIGAAVLFVGRALLAGVTERFAHRSATRVIAELRAQVLDHAAALGPRWLARHGAHTATTLTRGLDALEPYFVRYLPQLLLAAVLTPAVLVVMATLDLLAAVTVVALLPVIPMFMWLIGRVTQSYARRRLADQERLGAQLLDLLAGLATLQAFGRAIGPGARVRELAQSSRRTTMATLRVAFLSAAVLELFASLIVAAVAVGVGLRLVFGDVGLEAGLAVLILAPEALLPIRQVGVHFHASADGLAAADRVHAVLDEPLPTPGRQPAPVAVTAVSWQGVGVQAADRGYFAPRGLTGLARAGEVTALHGPNGAGKSTAVLTLIGALTPDEGEVRLHTPDGVCAVSALDPQSWWSQVAWVPQRPVLEPGTLAEYLGRPGVRAGTVVAGPAGSGQSRSAATSRRAVPPGDELDRAARATGLDRVVAGLPQGWNTRIGQGGVGLSLGERQRLALTRALLAPAPVLVLDEPTAHLDQLAEAQLLEVLRGAAAEGRVVIVVAHRESLLEACDAVIEVRSDAAFGARAEALP